MARGGSFGGTLDPFGSGALGGFSQYEIGSNLAELEVYRVEVAWGNGTATDEQYIEALTKAVNATDPETRDRESAQNRLDDVVYRIGRSVAEEAGLDQLIAFDQSAIAKMNPDNLRYRSVKDALDSELAERRSRDYGDLVREYNDGKVSTQKLVDWVTDALKGVEPDDPDYEHWTDTADDLADRLKSEKDEKVYQDYQQGRMKPAAFLAYLTGRRDEFDPTSPQFDDWSRRVEDATKQIKNDELAKKDQAFFNAYELGHKSDAQYLAYLRKRIDGMDADDPDLGAWKHRLTQAAFSLAEDKLRFDVQRGKAPESKLRQFYKNYQRTLNPGSAEYRQIARALMSLGGGGGGGGGTAGKGKWGGVSKLGGKGSPKLIDPKYTLDNILPLLQINLSSKNKKATDAAVKALDLNVDRLGNARQRGDSVWLFQDPRKPGQMIAGRNPDGSPMLDSKGKPVMVPGSAYLQTGDQAYANLLGLKTDQYYQQAALSLASHDAKGLYYNLKLAANAEDRQRLVDSQAIERGNRTFYDKAQQGIDLALKTGDYAAAANLALAVQDRLNGDLANPMLDDTRRDRLENLSEKLGKNPLLPQVDPLTGQRIGGAIDLDNSSLDAEGNFTSVALLPGWHQVLDRTNERGAPDWGLVYDDVQDGTWEQEHVKVYTTYGGAIVAGEVKVRQAPVNASIVAKVPDGAIRSDTGTMFITYTDEHGRQVKAYSIDGTTWIRSLTGAPPQLELGIDLTKQSTPDGDIYVDPAGETVFKQNTDGSFAKNDAYFEANPGAVDWYGMANLRKRQATLGRVKTTKADGSQREGQFVSGEEERYIFGARSGIGGGVDVGAKGQAMQVVVMSDSGELNLTSMGFKGPDTGVRGGGGMLDTFDRAKPPKLTKDVAKGRGLTVNASTGFVTSRGGPNVNASTGFVVPTVKQQLPANTPDLFEGVGFARTATVPALTPSTRPTLGPSNVRAVLPPAPAIKGVRALPKPVAKKPAPLPDKTRVTKRTKPRTTSTVVRGTSTAL